jgi:hypothetical protein
MMESIIILATMTLLPVTFLPTIVTHKRRHKNWLAITVFNVIVALSSMISFRYPDIVFYVFFGWVGGLIWACTNDVEKAA